jgi:hypothetical protein
VWTWPHLRQRGGRVLLCIPQRGSVDDRSPLRAVATRPQVVTATWRTLSGTGWRGGPVVAAWPDRDVLADLAERPGVTALCVLSTPTTWSPSPPFSTSHRPRC